MNSSSRPLNSLWKAFLVFAFLLVVAMGSAQAQPINSYVNSGNNLTGFTTRFNTTLYSTDGTQIFGAYESGWSALPARVSGDFKIEFDVYGDSSDVDAHLLLVDDATNAGIDCRVSPQGTDTPNINIIQASDLASRDGFYFPTNFLAAADSTHFPLATWTHVTINKLGTQLSVNVGGQKIVATVTTADLPNVARVGLGYYGKIRFKNILVGGSAPVVIAAHSYLNSGDNLDGFKTRFNGTLYSTNGGTIFGAYASGWDALPVVVNGNFKIDFDVYGNSNDVDTHLLLVDEVTNGGLDFRASPAATDTPNINIIASPNLASRDGFYYPTDFLAEADVTKFTNHRWTHVSILRQGEGVTYNVGGQIISAALEPGDLPTTARVGLGYYGTIRYRNISVAPLVQVSAGYDHAASLASDGTVWSWGINNSGQLGVGSVVPQSLAPTPVMASAKDAFGGVAAISAGYSHTVALKADGSVWAWGRNSNGQIGDGTTAARFFPSNLPSLAPVKNVKVIAVSAGSYHTLALKSDGTVWAWGSNSKGQLGNHSLAGQSTIPVQVLTSPTAPLKGIIAISAGGSDSMALAGDGTVYTWGDNSRGQLGLGDGATATKTVATLIPAVKLGGVIKIASGASHNVALKSDGTVWSWGSNSFGELGDSTTTDNSNPKLVPGLTGVVALAAGGFFNTSTNLANGSFTLAQDKNGIFSAWGADSTNQLCDGYSGISHNQLSPRVIAPLLPLSKIGALSLSAGCYYGLLLNDDGSVSGWGQNSVGQLGNGATSTVQRSLVQAINFNVFSE